MKGFYNEGNDYGQELHMETKDLKRAGLYKKKYQQCVVKNHANSKTNFYD